MTPAQLRVLTKQHRLVHVGRGAYVDAAKLATQTPEGQHALRARAIAATLPDTVALSHHSAACLLDLPFVGTPPVRVHAARRAGGEHRRTTHYTIHTAYPRARSHKVKGVWLVEPAVVVLGVAALHGLTQAVVTGDAALHAKLLGREDLKAVLDSCRYHPGVPTLRAALPQLDPACESPGESKARMLLKLLGYAVRSQVTIADEFGDWVARVDFLLEGHKVVIEFDGMTKYVSLDGSADPKEAEAGEGAGGPAACPGLRSGASGVERPGQSRAGPLSGRGSDPPSRPWLITLVASSRGRTAYARM